MKKNNRIAFTGELYVMCNDCGARLWSADALPNQTHDISINCPYIVTINNRRFCEPDNEKIHNQIQRGKQ